MTWGQQSEGLDPLCTTKGSHTGSGGRIAHFIAAISFNKELILSEQYFGKISGQMFADFVHKHFKEAFSKKVTIQRTNSFFRMVIHHKTAER